MFLAASSRTTREFVRESDRLRELSGGITRGELAPEILFEVIGEVGDYLVRKERSGIDEADQRLGCPLVGDRELVRADHLESCFLENLPIRPLRSDLLPPGRHPVMGVHLVHPPVKGGRQRLLPRCLAVPRGFTPQQREISAGSEPATGISGDDLTAKTVKGVSDGNEAEGLLRCEKVLRG